MNQSTDLTRFIPFSASDIKSMCLSDSGVLNDAEKVLFSRLTTLMTRYFGFQAQGVVGHLKSAYKTYDPDSDLLQAGVDESLRGAHKFEALLKSLLNQANFESISETSIQNALGDSSIFKVRLKVDFTRYEEVLLFFRGSSSREEIVPKYFGLRKQKITFLNYDRVLVYIRVKPNDQHSAEQIMLRLFQNVPAADLEMLFPDTKVGLRTIDKIVIGVPAVVSGVLVVTTKLGATLIILGSLIGFYLGLHSDPVTLDKPTLVAIGAGLGAVAGYFWKQLSNFKNRKLKFVQALTSNLYFKLLDTNAGVFYRIADSAADEELKEALLAYFFLLQSPAAISSDLLDERIQFWFADKWSFKLDFEVDDALSKLAHLGLAKLTASPDHINGIWKAINISDAVGILEKALCEELLSE